MKLNSSDNLSLFIFICAKEPAALLNRKKSEVEREVRGDWRRILATSQNRSWLRAVIRGPPIRISTEATGGVWQNIYRGVRLPFAKIVSRLRAKPGRECFHSSSCFFPPLKLVFF
jgi:hypothetical protein